VAEKNEGDDKKPAHTEQVDSTADQSAGASADQPAGEHSSQPPASRSAGTSEDPPADPLIFISDRYKIKRIIGGGGVGSVYEAFDTTLKKSVAIKKLNNASTSTDLIRFQREAKLTSALTHPNVRSVVDFGLTDKNEPYLVLELAKGESVGEFLKKHGSMDVETALTILIQVAAGLGHAHSRSIVHRDIKPSNVMLIERGNELIAQIVDFGIAKSQNTLQEITGDGVGLGTPLFMSPEQIMCAEIDHRSGIYSFGCLMYKILTGQPPFIGDTALDTTKMHTEEPIPSLSDKSNEPFSDDLEAIVRKALAKNPDDRYASIKDLSVDLAQELNRIQASTGDFGIEETSLSDTAAAKYGTLDFDGVAPGAAAVNRQNKMKSKALIGIVVASVAIGILALCFTPNFFTSAPASTRTSNPFREFSSKAPFVWIASDVTWNSDRYATPEDLRTLVKSEKRLERLNLSYCPKIDGAALSVLKDQQVHFLTFTEKPVNKETMVAISNIRSLQRVVLGGKGVTIDPEALGMLANLPKLVEVSLTYATMDDATFSALSKCKGLASLNLESSKGLAQLKWDRLKPLTRLLILMLNNTDIDDESLKQIAMIPNISSVYLRGTNVTDAGIRNLAKAKTLKIIGLSSKHNISETCIQEVEDKGIDVLVSVSYVQDRFGIPYESIKSTPKGASSDAELNNSDNQN